MIDIKPETLSFLQERVEKLNRNLKKKNQCRDVESLINKILENYIKKKQNEQHSNTSTDWVVFCQNQKVNVYIRERGKCFYCKKRISQKETTLDHKIPAKRGGTICMDNIVASCLWCNQDKGFLTAEEYYYKQLHNAAQGIYPE